MAPITAGRVSYDTSLKRAVPGGRLREGRAPTRTAPNPPEQALPGVQGLAYQGLSIRIVFQGYA